MMCRLHSATGHAFHLATVRARGLGRRMSNDQNGYSLIEAMVVLLIIGITLAAAVPNVGRYMQHDAVRMAAHNFRSACAVAQKRATATRTRHRVVYEPSGGRYYVEKFEAGSWVFASNDTTRITPNVSMIGGTDGDASNTVLTFEAPGTVASSDVPATIRFYNSHRDTSVVRVVRTGRMTLRHN